jgi:diguanylate cyclase (GGDEF)-like protein
MVSRVSRISSIIARGAPSVLGLDSLRSRVVVFALLAALIPTAITAFIAYTQTRHSLTERINQELRSITTQTTGETQLWYEGVLYEARVYASAGEVRENLETVQRVGRRGSAGRDAVARLTEYLRSVQELNPEYGELVMVTPDGELVASSVAEPAPLRLRSDWLTSVRPDLPVVGDPYWEDAFSAPIFTIATSVSAADARLLGILIAKLNLSPIATTRRSPAGILSNHIPGESGEVYLLDDAGHLIISSRASSRALMNTNVPAEIRQMLATTDKPSVRYIGYRENEVVGRLLRVERLGWSVVAEIPVEEAFAPVTRLRNLTVLLVVGVFLVVGFIAYRLALVIIRPLDRLSKGAAEVAWGDLAVELPATGGGEIGYLTQVFNYMVGRLRAAREELEATHEDLREKNEELERLSVTDALTGLYNRRYLMGTLDHEAQRSERTGQPFTLIMLDVDRFKRFNDTYGHQAGDQVLINVGSVLREATRVVDCASRYGGEEFVVMLPETDVADATDVAERIRATVSERPLIVDGKEAVVTVSVGVAEFPTDGDSVQSVVAAADAALYLAKKQGRNRVTQAKRKSSTKRSSARASDSSTPA